jgi:hypothetical protein
MYLLRGGARSAAAGPSAQLLLTEPLRGLVDPAALLVAAPGLLAAPRGDGQVRCSHVGSGVDAATRWLIADRLAWSAGRQVLFRPPLPLRPQYPRPAQGPR